jgi:UDP-N-acetylmuramate dehydrogenase
MHLRARTRQAFCERAGNCMTIQFERDVPLAPFTTLGIGGPARFFARITSVDQLREALAFDGPVFILGGGSNLLIADEGFDGLVIRIELRGVEFRGEIAQVAAGEPWDEFVAMAVERGLAGIECLSGIPGLTGATPIQNVGAYGQDVSETIDRVEAFDRKTSTIVEFTNEECRFGYRASYFKNVEKERYVILSVTFRLNAGGPASVRYPELDKYLDGERDLRRVREAVIAIRKRKGMVLDPNDPDTRSDGSFFMNPVITDDQYTEFAMLAPDAPHFAGGAGHVKLSAAWLIEHAGFQKGFVHGNVGLSSKHTLAVINRGGGTASEVLELVCMIQDRVRAAFAVDIYPEPNFIGFATLGRVLPHTYGAS